MSEPVINTILTGRKLIAFAIVWDVIFTAAVPFMNLGYSVNSANLNYASMGYRAVMYLHGLLVAYVATLALIVCELFTINGRSMQGHARAVIRYSALFGVLLGGIGGIVNFGYINASGIGIINDMPTWIQIASFLALDEMAVALLAFLVTAPKSAGVGYKNAGLPYYLLTLSVASALIGAIMGHLGGWIIAFGNLPAPFSGYVSWLGLDTTTFAANLVGSHSHEMAVALMAGIVALTAQRFGYSRLGKKGRSLARLGLAVAITGVILMTGVYVAAGAYNYSIPTLFVSGPNGANGIAFDDLLTGLVGMGALLLAIALIGPWYRKVYGSNPAKAAVLTTWIIAILTVPVLGYWIEMNESFYGAGGSIAGAAGAATDATYMIFHQQLAFFVMPALAAAILAMDYYLKSERKKKILSLAAIGGSWLSFAGGISYVFVSPAGANIFLVLEYAGAAVIALSALVVALYLFGALEDRDALGGQQPPTAT